MKQRLLYFAYGSNMSYDRLADRIKTPIVAGTYTIYDHVLKFNCGYQKVRYGNIVEEKGSKIEGVLYEITDFELAVLDRYECYPHNYYKIYFYDKQLDAIIIYYKATPYFTDTEKVAPDLYYLNYLLQGAAENNLNYTYDKLTEYKKTHYKLKALKSFKRK